MDGLQRGRAGRPRTLRAELRAASAALVLYPLDAHRRSLGPYEASLLATR